MSLKVRVLFIVLSIGFLTSFARAEALKTLKWEDLAPPVDDLRKQFDHLDDEQLTDAYELYNLIEWQKKATDSSKEAEGIPEQIKELETKLKKQKLDADALVKKIANAMSVYKKRKEQPIKELDGIDVRIPGYVLPLEYGDAAVTEFFLVPYVGACIHTPPPPANQIIMVKLNQSYKPKGLYDAVWVTGRMAVKKSKHRLAYRDGRGQVSTTYHLTGTAIRPYRE